MNPRRWSFVLEQRNTIVYYIVWVEVDEMKNSPGSLNPTI